MRFFSKKQSPIPKIIVEGIEIQYDQKLGMWEFSYRGTEFSSFEPTFTLPATVELDAIVETLGLLEPEMKSKIQKELNDWGDSKINDGESYSVNVQEFVSEKSFTVDWSDGESWGDMNVTFTIKDQKIVDVCWSD